MPIERLEVHECTGCGKCVQACPMDVLRMDDVHGVAAILYRADCISCFRCELRCPAACIWVAPAEPAREGTPNFVLPMARGS